MAYQTVEQLRGHLACNEAMNAILVEYDEGLTFTSLKEIRSILMHQQAVQDCRVWFCGDVGTECEFLQIDTQYLVHFDGLLGNKMRVQVVQPEGKGGVPFLYSDQQLVDIFHAITNNSGLNPGVLVVSMFPDVSLETILIYNGLGMLVKPLK